MTDPVKLQYQHSKCTIANRLNKTNCIYERAVSNRGVIKTSLKLKGYIFQSAAQSIKTKTKINHADM